MNVKKFLAVLWAVFAVGGLASAADTATNGLVLNFHEVPLSAVLNDLSARAGLIVVSDVNLQGSVTLVSKQPVTTNEIVDLLNAQLARNNYAAVLNGRMLTIMDAARARTSFGTPVIVSDAGPAQIPLNDEIVTEILPLQSLQAVQLAKDLASLIPASDSVTANESGNALIITAAQKDIHRVSEIIAALDSSSVSDVKVFLLKFGDAKSVAAELKDVFHSADSESSRAGTRNNFRGPGGPLDGGGNGGNSSGDKNSQTHAVFVSDDQMNAVVASAPPSYMPIISKVIEHLDVRVAEATMVRVFTLKHADPTEIVDELSTLFPSSSNSDDNSRSPGFNSNPFDQGGSDSSQSSRMKRKTAVLAVADRRTESVIVTASKDLMQAIGGMIVRLDEGSAGMKHVTAIPLQSADGSSVTLTLAGLFTSQNSSGSAQSTSALSARAQADNNSQSSSSTSATSGFTTGNTEASSSR